MSASPAAFTKLSRSGREIAGRSSRAGWAVGMASSTTNSKGSSAGGDVQPFSTIAATISAFHSADAALSAMTRLPTTLGRG